MNRDRLTCVRALTSALVAVAALAATETTVPQNRIRENTPAVHALINARIVVSPGKVVEKGTLVVRDGVIVAVGASVAPPADARIWDMSGKTLYAGLIDAYSELPGETPQPKRDETETPQARPESPGTPQSGGGASYWNPQVVPQFRVDRVYIPDKEKNKKLRAEGITARLLAPSKGLIKGTSALISTSDGNAASAILRDRVALHAKFSFQARWGEDAAYPTSPMGAFALFRQAFYDADWYRKAWDAYGKASDLPRPEKNDALEALQDYSRASLPVVIDAPDELYFLRADQAGREFKLNVIVRGSGREYRRLDAVKATGRPVILPVAPPETPKVKTPEEGMTVSLGELLHWDISPENAGILEKAGVQIAFTSAGLKPDAKFLDSVRKLVERGLTPEGALRALTTAPAAMFGMTSRLGTLEPGKAANIVVANGDIFSKGTSVLETWVDGQRYETDAFMPVEPRGEWGVTIAGQATSVPLKLSIKGEPGKLSGKLHVGEKETDLQSVALDDRRLVLSVAGEAIGRAGIVRMSGTIAGEALTGGGAWADGAGFTFSAARTAPFTAEPPKGEVPSPSLYAVKYPLGSYGVAGPPQQPSAVLFTNVTVWTCGPRGVIPNASVLVERGKIAAVGVNLKAPRGAIVVDVSGKHITPGLIDCHSHTATDGGINESGQAISAEVRIGDFVDCNDINIYRQLGGGVTAANVLHGSANPIGGQNQVIKMRWGELPEQMKFEGAPPGIKFALGENVKQSNWGDRFTTRYPQTRMGVEQLVRDEFNAALDYKRHWADWRAQGKGMPPRVDLELEAIVEVLEGKRLVHCHSYRQDEVLALLRTFESFGIRLATLQHILEGYKVADAVAKHGAGASMFSDWWTYKIEVYDAIPYNGALMHNAGVVVSFNSDSDEQARRLNTEAAKAVKYGSLSEEEALAFVTSNPAKQLRVDNRVGSIEAGKDADLAIWSGPPLSTFSRCEQTWIDGRKYFDLADDQKMREEAAKERAALIQKVLKAAAGEEKGKDEKKGAKEEKTDEHPVPPRADVYCITYEGNEGRR